MEADSTPLYDRPDLAITHEDAIRKGGSLMVVVHNIGIAPSGPFTVEVKDASGRRLASEKRPSLDGVGDLNDKKEVLTFDDMPVKGALVVTVVGPKKEITEVNNVARIGSP